VTWPGPERLNLLERTCLSYQLHGEETGAVRSYLSGRGLSPRVADYYRLGLVRSGLRPEHARQAGYLAVPILKECGPVSFKFRCIDSECKINTPEEHHEGHPKFHDEAGSEVHLYGTGALLEDADELDLVEGHPDVWALRDALDAAVLGIPGVETWKKNHRIWRRLITGHRVTRFWQHPDEAGRKLGAMIAADYPEVVLVTGLPADVNDTYRDYGRGYLAEVGGL
jgi:DNA primase